MPMERQSLSLLTIPVSARRRFTIRESKPWDAGLWATELRWALHIPDEVSLVLVRAPMNTEFRERRSLMAEDDLELLLDQIVDLCQEPVQPNARDSVAGEWLVDARLECGITAAEEDGPTLPLCQGSFEAGPWSNPRVLVLLVGPWRRLAEWHERETFLRPRWGERCGEALGRFFGCADSTLAPAEGAPIDCAWPAPFLDEDDWQWLDRLKIVAPQAHNNLIERTEDERPANLTISTARDRSQWFESTYLARDGRGACLLLGCRLDGGWLTAQTTHRLRQGAERESLLALLEAAARCLQAKPAPPRWLPWSARSGTLKRSSANMSTGWPKPRISTSEPVRPGESPIKRS